MKRIQYNAPATLTFTFASLLVLGIIYLTDGEAIRLLFSVYRAPLRDPLMYLRLFGHALGHADLNHFIGNFMIILLVGPMLEEKYGAKKLTIMIVITAFVTGLLFVIFTRPSSPATAMLGASGVVYMMMLLGSFTNMEKGRIPLTLILALAVFLGREFYASVATTSNIAHATHIIGGICGALFGFLHRPKTV